MNENVFHQVDYRIRFDWGQEAIRRLAPLSDVVVVVDVLSFTTCVDVAVSRGAAVFPYRYKDETAKAFAKEKEAHLAGERGTPLSLSPSSLMTLQPGSRVVLPSPNGSTCTVVAAENGAGVIAGCLRNAFAVADFIKRQAATGVVTVIAGGEHWPNGNLRPSIEDLLGAGAILSQFDSHGMSPEARVAAGVFQAMQSNIQQTLETCASGRELLDKGFPDDVAMASALNVSDVVPVLHDGFYTNGI